MDCEGQVKDGPFVYDILISVIEQVTTKRVVQVIMDNTKNYRVVDLLVDERYQHIFWTPCVVHSLKSYTRKG